MEIEIVYARIERFSNFGMLLTNKYIDIEFEDRQNSVQCYLEECRQTLFEKKKR